MYSLAGGLAAANGGLGNSLAGLSGGSDLFAEDNNAALFVGDNADGLFNIYILSITILRL